MRFCIAIKPYMTLSYAIKHGDTDFLCHVIREVAIILQALAANKPKYARTMLQQL